MPVTAEGRINLDMDILDLTKLSPLFEAVQLQQVFPDGKTFVDCDPRSDTGTILAAYGAQKDQPGFNLRQFVLEHFELPVAPSDHYQSDVHRSVADNLEKLWPLLTRQPDQPRGSLIPLPHPYIVPGGRFGEIYYWDSYFTMLGLAASGHTDMVENMTANFTYLIEQFGYIPNGNRSYFLGRSQPPFYALMVALLSSIKGAAVLSDHLPALEKEYAFWTRGEHSGTNAAEHSIRMPDGSWLNRYWDENDTPRAESYREDVELAAHAGTDAAVLYRHLRAGAESGWDYSHRWFREAGDFSTIHCTEIVPVDLNCLLHSAEIVIATAHRIARNEKAAKQYDARAAQRAAAIQQYCWNGTAGFFFDFDAAEGRQKQVMSMAAAYPLYCGIATPEQADAVAEKLHALFLKDGGFVTTLEVTGQQWDAPNGWAPLQLIAIKGLEQYGHHDLAREAAQRWLKLNQDVFSRTGKMMEKYNVVNTALEAGGGEYSGQDGFGWTNGVYLALLKNYG